MILFTIEMVVYIDKKERPKEQHNLVSSSFHMSAGCRVESCWANVPGEMAVGRRLCWGDHKTQLAAAIRTNMTSHTDLRLSCQVFTRKINEFCIS